MVILGEPFDPEITSPTEARAGLFQLLDRVASISNSHRIQLKLVILSLEIGFRLSN